MTYSSKASTGIAQKIMEKFIKKTNYMHTNYNALCTFSKCCLFEAISCGIQLMKIPHQHLRKLKYDIYWQSGQVPSSWMNEPMNVLVEG